MNSKLKELRKFLPPSPFLPTPETSSGHDSQVSQTPWVFEQLPAANSAEPAEPRDALTAQSSPQIELLAEQDTDNSNGQVAVENSKSVDQLGQAIAKLFEPAQRCKEQLAEIANASDPISGHHGPTVAATAA